MRLWRANVTAQAGSKLDNTTLKSLVEIKIA